MTTCPPKVLRLNEPYGVATLARRRYVRHATAPERRAVPARDQGATAGEGDVLRRSARRDLLQETPARRTEDTHDRR